MSNDPTLWSIDAHTKGKHRLLEGYVNAWLPIMTRFNKRVVLVDGFCGPGRYEGGERGSPLIMLDCYLNHKFRAQMSSEIRFVFIDDRPDRIDHLKGELEAYALPANVKVTVECGRYENTLSATLDALEDGGQSLAPTLTFIDPFGYSQASMDLTGRILRFQRCEALIYMPLPFVRRFVGREGQDAAMTSLFGTDRWREAIALDGDERDTFLHDLFRDQLHATGSQYVRSFEIRHGAAHGYHLFFASNHEMGLKKMKEAMWSVDPIGGTTFSDSTITGQGVLFEAMPNWETLVRDMRTHFGSRAFTIEEAERYALIDTAFLPSHIRQNVLIPAEMNGQLEMLTERRKAKTYPSDTSMKFR